MNKLLIASLIAVSANCIADGLSAEQLAWAKQHFAAEGLPIPDSGIKIVPSSKMIVNPATTRHRLIQKKQMLSMGHVNEASPVYKQLMDVKNISKETLHLNSMNYGPTDEEMRSKISELKIAYHFVGVPALAAVKSIGFVPAVTYVKDKGWAGASQFFTYEGIGVCHYDENNLKFSHGAAIIAEEDISRAINGKATTVEIYGQKGKGFVYNIEWYDNDFFKQLECANPNYDADIKNQMLMLARIIDKQKR